MRRNGFEPFVIPPPNFSNQNNHVSRAPNYLLVFVFFGVVFSKRKKSARRPQVVNVFEMLH